MKPTHTLTRVKKSVKTAYEPDEFHRGIPYHGDPKVGQTFILASDDSVVRTSLVKSIRKNKKSITFKTLNSTYRLKPIS